MIDTSLIPDFEAKNAQIKQGNQQFIANQANQSNDFLNRFRGAIGGQEKTSAMAGRIGQELGLPTLQKNAFMLNQTVDALPQTIQDATQGFDVNQNQMDRMIGNKLAKLSPLAQRATAQAQNAQQSLDTQMGYAQQDQNRELMPYNTEQSMLSDRMARETTLYSQANQQELDGLIQKMNAGITLSEGEKNRAAQLAASEKQYELQKESLNQQKQANNKPNTQIINQGGKQFLIDSGTGKIISTYANQAPKAVQPTPGASGSSLLSNPVSPPSYFKPIG